MTNSLVTLLLIPVLVYWLSRKPHSRGGTLPDYVVPLGMDVRAYPTHWGSPPAVTRFNSALLTEVKCHPAFVERDIPDVWFKWSPADARRRARMRLALPERDGVLSIRKQA